LKTNPENTVANDARSNRVKTGVVVTHNLRQINGSACDIPFTSVAGA